MAKKEEESSESVSAFTDSDKEESKKEVSDKDSSSSEEIVQKSQHLSEKNEFLGWKKTSISIIREKGKSKNDGKYLKKKKLLKKLWSVYEKSIQYADLSLDQQNRGYKSIEDVVMKIIGKETKKFSVDGSKIYSKNWERW